MVRTAALAAALLFSTPKLAFAQSPGTGYWRTEGNRIVDASGAQVRFSGVNWNGFESGNYVVHGLWGGARNWKSMLDQMRTLGFNLIRLPFSGDIFGGRMPLNIDTALNPDLAGKSSLEIMDMIVAEAGARGIRIILDYHRIQAGYTPENGLWYVPGSGTYTEQGWIDNWRALVGRYLGNPTVVGCDLFNEVHADASHPGPFWSADGANEPYNWRTAARRCAEAVLSVNPNLLICVQGLHEYGGQTSWWGANLMGLADHPFTLSVPNRVVYEIHDYGPNVWNQPWHNAPNFPANLPGFWDGQWGFVHDRGIGPVWVGEWGSKLDIPKEVQWAATLRDYIQAKGLSWTWWTWSPNSGDTGGILQDDWQNVQQAKLDLVAPVMYPGFAPSGGGSPPSGGGPGSASSGGGGKGSEGCGLTGLEALLVLAFLRRRKGQGLASA